MLPDLYITGMSALKFDNLEQKKSIDGELKQHLPTLPRRLNTYTKAALLGAVKCVDGKALANADVFLCSHHISLDVMDDLIRSTVFGKEPPKPINFIHSIGNSTTFYISQQLNLSGESLFLAEQNDCLAALMLLAALKIYDGRPAVLLGNVIQDRDSISTSWMLLEGQRAADAIIKIEFKTLTDGENDSAAYESRTDSHNFHQFCQNALAGNYPNNLHTDKFQRQSGLAINLISL